MSMYVDKIAEMIKKLESEHEKSVTNISLSLPPS